MCGKANCTACFKPGNCTDKAQAYFKKTNFEIIDVKNEIYIHLLAVYRYVHTSPCTTAPAVQFKRLCEKSGLDQNDG